MDQLELFDKNYFSINKKIRLIELFSGYNSQQMAMRNIGADFESWKTSEWQVASTISSKAIFHADDNTDYSKDMTDDEVMEKLVSMGISIDDEKPVSLADVKRKGIKWCRTTYNTFKACHNLGSITNFHGKDLEIIDKDKYCYFMFYSFCCQDLSNAGKQAGMKKGSGTRSGLLWEVERLLTECKEHNGNLPDVLCLENVPQLISEKNMPDFTLWLEFLRSLGYSNHYQILNAKDFGVPQNRERCFMFSFLGEYDYDFPTEIPLQYRLKDVLEEEVDEKYYINSEKADKLIEDLLNRNVLPISEERGEA